METIIVKIYTGDMISEQVFIDDREGAANELNYWNGQGVRTEVSEVLETSDNLH